uniref:AlNc14C21G2148 protein n=1 Tax=Albugo laibachii Nc14 TaxID=890382 RepID=F0W5I3_9STRA|nr:AlNc14C21G2148 [Albugo laibachii Nc14]|eukprot:CCA16374.1 AlNc14C21G2148 [Albugo laibachii Nc14]
MVSDEKEDQLLLNASVIVHPTCPTCNVWGHTSPREIRSEYSRLLLFKVTIVCDIAVAVTSKTRIYLRYIHGIFYRKEYIWYSIQVCCSFYSMMD